MEEPNRSGGGNLEISGDIDALASIGPRRPGSEAERRAARALEKRLRELGRDVVLEPTRVRPSFGLTHLIHAIAGIVASVLSVYLPSAGLVLALVTTASAFGDLTGSFHLARALTPARASQNVVSDEDDGKPGLIVLVAHYDSPLGGMLADRRLRAWPKALFYALLVVTLCTVGRLIGIDATLFTLVQFIPTVVLIALTPLFADSALADARETTADNAAGVAVVLELAQSRLDHFDLMLAFTGASADGALGMRGWLGRHRGEVDAEATAVIAVDNIGTGEPAYAVKEGPIVGSRMHPTLTEIAGEAGGESYDSGELSDSYLARSAGLPTLRISSTEPAEDADRETVRAVREFVARLLDQIDAEIGPRLS